MFKAIINSKIRNHLFGGEHGEPWRRRYKECEDFLTASVFARLSYLPPDIFWNLLSTSVVSNHILPNKTQNLNLIEFWPKWYPDKRELDFYYKEPDVFLSFDELDIIVEAKLRGTQDPRQLANEFMAYLSRPEPPPKEQVYLLAIEGIPELSRATVQEVEVQVNKVVSSHYDTREIKPHLLGCSWKNLLSVLHEVISKGDNEFSKSGMFLFNDLMEIFGFHGFRLWYWLEKLGEYVASQPIDEMSFNELSSWMLKPTYAEENQKTELWCLDGDGFRPILTSSIPFS